MEYIVLPVITLLIKKGQNPVCQKMMRGILNSSMQHLMPYVWIHFLIYLPVNQSRKALF